MYGFLRSGPPSTHLNVVTVVFIRVKGWWFQEWDNHSRGGEQNPGALTSCKMDRPNYMGLSRNMTTNDTVPLPIVPGPLRGIFIQSHNHQHPITSHAEVPMVAFAPTSNRSGSCRSKTLILAPSPIFAPAAGATSWRLAMSGKIMGFWTLWFDIPNFCLMELEISAMCEETSNHWKYQNRWTRTWQ